VTRADLVSSLEAAGRAAPLALVDVCVPRNVEAEVDSLANVASYDIDALKAVVARNTEARRIEVEKAKFMMRDHKEEWLEWHRVKYPAMTTLKNLLDQAELERQRELLKYEDELRLLSYKERDTVEWFTQALVQKLMRQPIMQLSKDGTTAEKDKTIGEFKNLFELYAQSDEVRQKRDDAARLLQYLADNVCESCRDSWTVTAANMPADSPIRNFNTHPRDTKRALARERLAEISTIGALACGILQATQQTLDYIDKRADAIRSRADKFMVKEYNSLTSEVLEDKKCPVEQVSPEGYSLLSPEGYSLLAPAAQDGLARERSAEADSLNYISQKLAEASMSAVTKLRDRAEVIRKRELSNREKYLESLDAKLVDKISSGIVNALLAGPASHLTSAQAVDEKSRTLELFADIFGIQALEGDQAVIVPKTDEAQKLKPAVV
jgi:glutamyl-tRNA reductase